MVNIIHLKEVNTPNHLCSVKGHEKNYPKVSPAVLARQKAWKHNDGSREGTMGQQFQLLWLL